MAQSLVKLTLESNQYEKNLRQAKRSLDDFTKQIGINAKALTGMGAAVSVAVGAVNVMKDAFFASEKAVDEWGRTIESAKSTYDGFLNALNNSDISGFLGRMDQIVRAAREAYDAVDNLGTLKTIQTGPIAQRQAENDRMRMMIQTGRYIAPSATSGLKASMEEGAVLSKRQLEILERQYQNGTKEMVKLVGNEAKATKNAIEKLYGKLAAETGMSVKELRAGTSSWENFMERLKGAENYQRWQQENSYVDQSTGRLVAPRTGNPFQKYKGWDVLRIDGEQVNTISQYIQRLEQLNAQEYNLKGQTFRTINRLEGYRPSLKSGSSGSGKTKETYAEGSIAAQRELVAKLTKQYESAGASTRDGIKKELDEANKILQQMIQGTRQYLTMDLSSLKGTPLFAPKNEDLNKIVGNMSLRSPIDKWTEELQKLTDEMNSSLTGEEYQRRKKKVDAKERQIKSFKGEKDDNKDMKQEVGNLLGGVNSIVSGIEQMGIQIPQEMQNMIGVLNGIFTVVEGISAAVTAIEFLSGLPLARGGIVHAEGGCFVPGNSYSGDRVPALLNSGELVLNRAQQGNLASQLEGGAIGNLRLSATITGEQIRLALNNNGKRTGRGEIVQSRFRG